MVTDIPIGEGEAGREIDLEIGVGIEDVGLDHVQDLGDIEHVLEIVIEKRRKNVRKRRKRKKSGRKEAYHP